MRRAWVIWLAAAPALAGAGCQTVDLGNPPADINACRPSQDYYVGNPSDGGQNGGIWSNVLDHDYGGGKKCTNSACHGAGSTNSLKLTMPTGCIPPTAGCVVPIPLTQEWAANYRATAEQMNCSNVTSSRLLAKPGGLVSHGGLMIFDASTSPEAQLIIGWVGAFP